MVANGLNNDTDEHWFFVMQKKSKTINSEGGEYANQQDRSMSETWILDGEKSWR
jgi:hypothetical protein